MKRTSFLARVANAVLISVSSTLIALTATGGPLPSVRIATAPLVSPSAAATYYGGSLQHSYGVLGFGVGSARPRPPEIVELARALKNSPDLIYEHVRNNIRINFQYGLQKGALGAIIDRSGTAFDQAQLMVELLRQSGYSASYRIGTITLNGAQWASWSGLSDSRTTCQHLASGGIPASFSGSSDPGCNYGGSVVSVTLGHAWVEAVIEGRTVVFDPAFKEHEVRPRQDLQAIMSYLPGTAFSQATRSSAQGGTFQKGTSNLASGLAPWVSGISGMSVGPLADALLSWIRSQKPDATLDDILGGERIIPLELPPEGVRQVSLPYANATSITVSGDIPDTYRTKLLVRAVNAGGASMVDIMHTFFVDEVHGRRMRIDTDFDWATAQLPGSPLYQVASLSATAGMRVSLKVDEVEVVGQRVTIVQSPDRFSRQLDVVLAANHPFAAAASPGVAPGTYNSALHACNDQVGANSMGSFADRCIRKRVYILTPVTIAHGWGDVSGDLLGKWSTEAADDRILPRQSFSAICAAASQPAQGLCGQGALAPATDFGRDKMAAAWLAQFSRMLDLQARVAQGRAQHHNSLGFVYSDSWSEVVNGTRSIPGCGASCIWGIPDEMTVIDIDSSINVVSVSSDPVVRRAALHSIAAASSALESTVVEQFLNLPYTISTSRRFASSNSPTSVSPLALDYFSGVVADSATKRAFRFDPAAANSFQSVITFAGLSTGYPSVIPAGKPPAWKAALQAHLQPYLQQGFTVFASAESYIGPGQVGGSKIVYSSSGTNYLEESRIRGGAFVAVRNDTSGDPIEIAHVVTNLRGGFKGGGAGSSAASQAAFSNETVGQSLSSRFTDRSSMHGVDLQTGQLRQDFRGVLATGGGSQPFKLSADWTYVGPGENEITPFSSSNHFSSPFNGVVNSRDARVQVSTNALDAMKQDRAEASAVTIATALLVQDLYRSGLAAINPDDMLTAQYAAPIVYFVWQSTVTHNVVMVSIGASTRRYVRVGATGTYLPPPGDRSVLRRLGTLPVAYRLCGLLTTPTTNVHTYSHYAGYDFDNLSNVANRTSFTITEPDGTILTLDRWIYNGGANCDVRGGWQLAQVAWPTGLKLTTTHTDGRITRITNSLGRFINHALSTTANSAPPAGAVWDPIKNLTVKYSTTDENGRAAILQATTSNTITLPDGGVIKLVYNAPVGRSDTQRPVPWPTLREVYEPANQNTPAMRFTYDSVGRVREVRDAISIAQGDTVRGPWRYFIADGARGEREDPLSPAGRYTVYHDGAGRAVRHVDEAGSVVRSAHDGLGRLLSRTYPESDQEVFQYDSRGNVVEMRRKAKPGTGLADIVTTAVWDTTWNKPLSVTDALGRVTNLSYNAAGTAGAGLVKEVLRPAALVGGVRPKYTFTYAATTGLVTQETSPIGTVQTTSVVTNHIYDAKGNRTRTVVDDTTTGKKLKTEWSYNAYGDVTRVMDPRGHVTVFTYWDTASTYSASGRFRRVAEELHSSNAVTTIGGALTGYLSAARTWYDANGRPTKVEGPTSMSGTTVTWNMTTPRTQTTYTLTGKVATVRDAAGDTVTTGYDPLDRPHEVTDPVGRKSKTVYTAAGEVQQLRRAVGTPLEQIYSTATYTPNGLVETVTDARGNVSKSLYDGFDRMSKALYPDATPANDNDNLYEAFTYDNGSRKVSERKRGGQVLTYSYDDLDRVVSRSGGGLPARSLTYDLGSRVQTVEDRNGTAVASSLSYTYDSAGRAVRERRNDWNQNVDFALDASGNTTTLTWPDGFQANYVFDGLNRVDRITGVLDGVTRTLRDHDYDVLSRRIQTTTLSDGLAGQGAGEVITSFSYEADDDLAALTHDYPGATPDLAFTHGYSAAGQLVSMAASEPLNRYSVPGPMGAQTYQVANALNQYPSITPLNGSLTALTHDLNGNLMDDGTNSYTFDALNRLVSVTGSVTAGYVHDALDRRVSKSVNGVTTRFLHAGSDEIAEYTDTGVLLRRYVPGAGTDERAAMIDSGSAAPPLASLRLPHADRLGSVMAVTNSAGAVTERFAYNVFGVSNGTSAGYPFRFTGQRIDPETGLMFYKARVYSTTLGRFLQTDPIGTKDDLNLYAYVGNDPVNKTDPSGKTFKLVKSVTNVAKRTWKNGGDSRKGAADEFADFADNVGTLVDGQITPDDALAVVDLLTGFGEELKTLQRAADVASSTVGKGKGAVHGTKVHTEFSSMLVGVPSVSTEVSYRNRKLVGYGTKGSVRVDAVIGDVQGPKAVIDLKTGTRGLSSARAKQIQGHLPHPCLTLCLRPDLE